MKFLRIDSQVLSSFSHCPLRCNLGFNDRLIPIGENKYFAMGKVVHVGFETYYNGIKNQVPFKVRHEQAIVDANTFAVSETELKTELIETCLKTIDEYFRYRKEDKIYVRSVEAPFSKVLYVGPDLIGEDITVTYEGKIDLIAESEELEVIDHKTTSKNQEPVDMRVQFIGYSWATGLRVVHNRVGFQTSVAPSEKFKRFTFKYRPEVIEAWQKYAIRKALQYARCLETNIWPPNFVSCEGAYGYPCQFINVCRYPSLAEETKKYEFKIGETWDIFKERNT